MPIDDDGVTTEPAESEDFSDAEAEFADLQEKADWQTAALQTIIDTTQNQQIKDEMLRMMTVMNKFSSDAGT